MGKIIHGPFNVTWGANTLEDIEEISLDYSQAEDDYETVQFQTRTVDGARKATATITLLKGDVAALGAIFPSYVVAAGSTMSTGETVDESCTEGAIDLTAAACDDEETFNDFEVEACDEPGQVLRLVNTRVKLDGIEIDGKVMKVMVKFIAQPDDTEAVIQFFGRGCLGEVS